MTTRIGRAALSSWLLVLLAPINVSATELAAVLRRPIALAQSHDGKLLYVANRDSGSISVVDIAQRRVVAEHTVGKRLADLVVLPGSSRLLAVDESGHELLFLDGQGMSVTVAQRLAISPYPVSVLISDDGKWATVASLWSRRLTFVTLEEDPVRRGSPDPAAPADRRSPNPPLNVTKVLDLDFAPRCQVHLSSRDRLIVADAFGGSLAIIEPSSQRIVARASLPAHNVRGLGVTPDGRMLMIAHQMLNDLAHSIRNDIHWGLLMSNDLRWLKVDSVLAGSQELYRGAHMHPLGDSGRGGGDPGGLDVSEEGTVVVALSGVNEVAFGKEGDFSMQRLRVPRRPTAIHLARDGQSAFVASTLDDSVSILDLEQRKITATISLGPKPVLSLAQQGELLFYDAKLSHDGWMSCHSCHTDGHANGQMNDNFSDRSFGAPKRVLSLLVVRDTLPLAWSGKVESFERQIHNSINSTMQRAEPLPSDKTQAIAAFLQTLELPPSVDVLRGTQDAAAAERGRLVFERLDCGRCHTPPTYTSAATYDVGLRDSEGNTQFNPPSLRGLSHRGPYFHDNRAATIDDVFLTHGHPNDTAYSAQDVKDLVAFLRSL